MSNPHFVTQLFEQRLCEYTGAPFAVAVNSCTMALTLAVAWCAKNWFVDLSGRWRFDGHLVDFDTEKALAVAGNTRIYNALAADGYTTLRSLARAEHCRKLANVIGLGVKGRRTVLNFLSDEQVLNAAFHPGDVSIPKRTYVSVPQAILHAGATVTFRDEDWLGSYQLKPLPVWDSARWFTSGMYGEAGRFQCVSFHASKTLGIEQGGAILHDNAEADAWLRRARFDGRAEGVAPKDDKGIILGYHCYMNPSTAAQGILKLHSLPKFNPPLPNDDYPDLSELDAFK